MFKGLLYKIFQKSNILFCDSDFFTQVDDRVEDGQDEGQEAERSERSGASGRTTRSTDLQMSECSKCLRILGFDSNKKPDEDDRSDEKRTSSTFHAERNTGEKKISNGKM